jgi:hypothetical protein
MSLVHKPIAWGCIVGVTLLGCIAGCSLKQEPVPLPPVPQAPEKAAPAPVPQAKEEAAPARTPRDHPGRHGLLVWAGFPRPGDGER